MPHLTTHPNHYTTALNELTAALDALLPILAVGFARGRPIAVQPSLQDTSTAVLALPAIPLTNALVITDRFGVIIDPTQYTIDLATGAIILSDQLQQTYPLNSRLYVTYEFSLADEFIRQAVNDLGRRLPRRNIAQTVIVAGHGSAQLPADLLELIMVTEIDPTCDSCGRPRCQRADNHHNCSTCRLFVSGATLIAHPAPCHDLCLELCYLGGYPLNCDGCFDGLTPQLADLVLLKAQAIAYSSPKLLLTLAGLSIGGDTSGNTNAEGTEESTRTKTETEEYDRCERIKTKTTIETISGIFDRSGSSAGTTNFFRSSTWNSLAQTYQTQYDDALRALTASAPLHRTCRYRTRILMT